MTIAEIWKQIPGFGGHYEASDLGRIRVKDRAIVKPHSRSGRPCTHLYRGRVLKITIDEDGYGTVHIGVDKKKTKLRVNRAVLMAFVGPAPEGMESCHNNGNPRDNTLGNLRWDTHFNNNQDRVKHGTYATGEAHHMAKITAASALEIYHSNERGTVLAEKYGVCQSKISAIRLGHIWVAVTGGVPRPNLNKGGFACKSHPQTKGNSKARYGTQLELLAEAREKLGWKEAA